MAITVKAKGKTFLCRLKGRRLTCKLAPKKGRAPPRKRRTTRAPARGKSRRSAPRGEDRVAEYANQLQARADAVGRAERVEAEFQRRKRSPHEQVVKDWDSMQFVTTPRGRAGKDWGPEGDWAAKIFGSRIKANPGTAGLKRRRRR
ncbi:MAG: hypothetical protein Q7R39_04530 [Dehalococcoidia bacterium]|nr:hypothetical protein [Dehalococcoidia bacterium]